MGINFEQFSPEFRKKYEEAIADKKLSQKEIEGFSASDQRKLAALISGDPKALGEVTLDKDVDMKMYQTKGDDGKLATIVTYPDQKGANEGLLDLTPDTIANYPGAKRGYFDKRTGVVTLYTQDGTAVKDSKGNVVAFNFAKKDEKPQTTMDWLMNGNSLASKYMESSDGKVDMKTLTALLEMDKYLRDLDPNSDEYKKLMADYQDYLKEKSYWSIEREIGVHAKRLREISAALDSNDLSKVTDLMCSYLQENFEGFDENVISKVRETLETITGAKWAGPALYNILNDIAQYVDNSIGKDENDIGIAERIVKSIDGAAAGLGDFIFSTEGGVTIGAMMTGEALIAKTAQTVAPYIGSAIHSYFGAEGLTMTFNGVKGAATATTLEELKEESRQIGPGLMMSMTLVKPAIAMYKGLKNIKFDGRKEQKVIEEFLRKELKQYLQELKEKGVEYKLVLKDGDVVLESTPEAVEGFVTTARAAQAKYKNAEFEDLCEMFKKAYEKDDMDTAMRANLELESRGYEVKIDLKSGQLRILKKDVYANMQPEMLIDMLSNPMDAKELTAIKSALQDKGYSVMERPIQNGKATQTVVYAPDGKPVEAKTNSAAAVSEEFVAQFDKCRSTQDLEMMVANAKTSAECDYIAAKLNNPNTMAVNRPQIERVIDLAKSRAERLRADEQSGVSEEFIVEFNKCRSTQDLEMMVANAKTSAECDYIAAKLNNPNTMAVNRPQIERVIDLAKFRAERLRADETGVRNESLSATSEQVLPDGTKVTIKNGRKTKELTPDGTERRFNAYDETLEFRPDKTFVKYDKDGNVIQTDIWEEIDGSKMSLWEAEYLWTGDHLGYQTLRPKRLSEIEAFMKSANNNNIAFLEKNGIKVLETYSENTGVVRDNVPAHLDTLSDNVIVIEYEGRAYKCHYKTWEEGCLTNIQIISRFRNQIEGKCKLFEEIEPQKEGVLQGNGNKVYEKTVDFKDTPLSKIKPEKTASEPAAPADGAEVFRKAEAKAKADGTNNIDLSDAVTEEPLMTSVGQSVNEVGTDFRAIDVITPETQAEFTQFARENNLRMEYGEHGVTFRDANNHIRRKVLLDSEGNIVKDNYPRGQEGLKTNTPAPETVGTDFRAIDVITPETQAEFTQFARENNLRMEYGEHGVTFRDANNHIRRKVLLDSEGNIVKDNYPRGQEGLKTNTPAPASEVGSTSSGSSTSSQVYSSIIPLPSKRLVNDITNKVNRGINYAKQKMGLDYNKTLEDGTKISVEHAKDGITTTTVEKGNRKHVYIDDPSNPNTYVTQHGNKDLDGITFTQEEYTYSFVNESGNAVATFKSYLINDNYYESYELLEPISNPAKYISKYGIEIESVRYGGGNPKNMPNSVVTAKVNGQTVEFEIPFGNLKTSEAEQILASQLKLYLEIDGVDKSHVKECAEKSNPGISKIIDAVSDKEAAIQPGIDYDNLSSSQKTKLNLLSSYGVEVKYSMSEYQGHDYTTEIKFTKDGQTTSVTGHFEVLKDGVIPKGMNEAFEKVLDAKLDEVRKKSKFEVDDAGATEPTPADAAKVFSEAEAKAKANGSNNIDLSDAVTEEPLMSQAYETSSSGGLWGRLKKLVGLENDDFYEFTTSEAGTVFPKNKVVLVNKNTILSLGDSYELDLRTLNLRIGEKATVGREGDIKVPDGMKYVSRKHLEIERIGENTFRIIDTSTNGTKISRNFIAEELAEARKNPSHDLFVQERRDLFSGMDKQTTWWQEFEGSSGEKSSWKMHLYSIEEMDWRQMCEVVIPYLKEHGVTFKTLSIRRSVNELVGDKQEGKAFTIYPKSNKEMEQVAKDLDKLIKDNNLTINDSRILGDRQMGNTGRLFYRYEYNSGKHKDEILDLSPGHPDWNKYERYYEGNRGIDNYLADDMTIEDDIWYDFDPSNKASHPKESRAWQERPESIELSEKDYIEAMQNSRIETIDGILDFSSASRGTELPKNEPVMVTSGSSFILADAYKFDMSDPSVQSILNSMNPGETVIVGRMGDIETPAWNRAVSRRHLEIEKIDDNHFLIQDISSFGTKVDEIGNISEAQAPKKFNFVVKRDFSKAPRGTELPKDEQVIVTSGSSFILADAYKFDMSDPSVQSVLSNMKQGETVIVGRMGDIKTPASNIAVSRKHLEIEKIDDNHYLIKDISSFGTKVDESGKYYLG